ncbi:MAG: aminoglycoside phosphotransferase [Chloroflexi bacterium]|nr:MAG: aminoglycoside phosphotransferase [Chloroflexota bacterium]MBL1194573.1 aminoglycoside phosphotransferase [Chloroflexota bacterium]NOH11862.1 phosphotransferase [Chloroflexota bacterium]
MRKGKLLAKGRTAEIYTWKKGKVLKQFLPGWPAGDAEYEFNKASIAQQTGLAVPKVYELIEEEGRPSIIYELIEGQTLLQWFQRHRWAFPRLARQMAELHLDMHQRQVSGLPSQSTRLKKKIEEAAGLDAKQKEKLVAYIDELPEADKLLHGDFHPDNIMVTPNGTVIIDWVDASSGHPLADVARTVLLTTMSAIPDDLPARRFFIVLREIMNRMYLRHYFKHSPYKREELKAWMLPVVAGRLSENIIEEQDYLVEYIRKRISLIDE